MASLSLSGGEEEFGWRITGLGSAFNQANGYVEAGITKYQFTHSSSSISGVVDSVRAPRLRGLHLHNPAVGGLRPRYLRFLGLHAG